MRNTDTDNTFGVRVGDRRRVTGDRRHRSGDEYTVTKVFTRPRHSGPLDMLGQTLDMLGQMRFDDGEVKDVYCSVIATDAPGLPQDGFVIAPGRNRGTWKILIGNSSIEATPDHILKLVAAQMTPPPPPDPWPIGTILHLKDPLAARSRGPFVFEVLNFSRDKTSVGVKNLRTGALSSYRVERNGFGEWVVLK